MFASSSERRRDLNPWRFACKRKDAETGWIYFGRRFYDPEVGRWTTPDPLLFVDGSNPYAYLHHSPLMAYDRNGLVGEAYDAAREGAFNLDYYLGRTDEYVTWDDFASKTSAWEAGLNAREMLTDCYHACGGALHASLDFVSRMVNDASAIACMIGSEDLGESVHERLAIQASFFDWQDMQQQSFDHWVTSTLHLDPNNAAYQASRHYTGTVLEVGTFAVAGVGVAKGTISGIRTLARASGTVARSAGKLIGKEIGCVARKGVLNGSASSLTIHQSLNEICNGMDLFEFQTRIGVSKEEVENLMNVFGHVINKIDAKISNENER